MKNAKTLCAVLAMLGSFVAPALGSTDDGKGLNRNGDARSVTISGVSSGAAMAIQYAVAYSASIAGVGAIAGPGWGCADGHVSNAIDGCLCGRRSFASRIEQARALADSPDGLVDPLESDKPKALKASYVFQSAADSVVVAKSGQESIKFLASFIGKPPVADWGNSAQGSDQAGHGIVSPEGTDSCRTDGNELTYVRRCNAEDNAGKLFLALFGNGAPYDATKRKVVPANEVWTFDQRALIEAVKQDRDVVASDKAFLNVWPYKSERRKNFDMADVGYLYVPPSCRDAAQPCRVHVALHGCAQNAWSFATRAGYNNWAEAYKVIVVYPAIRSSDQGPSGTAEAGICATTKALLPPQWLAVDNALYEPNDNGCWDWWGYLDPGIPRNRYLTKAGPQMKVIKRIVDAATSANR